MVHLLGWGLVIGTVVVIGAAWLLVYQSGRLPKRLLWLLSIVLATVCFALLGGVFTNFERGTVAAYAVAGALSGVGGVLWAEWPSLKHRLR